MPEALLGNRRVSFPLAERRRQQCRIGRQPPYHVAEPGGFQVVVQRVPFKMVPLRGYIYDFIEQTVKLRVTQRNCRKNLQMRLRQPWMIEQNQHQQAVAPRTA